MLDIVKLEDLDDYRKNNPDIKRVLVDHGPEYGLVELTFNCPIKEECTALSLGMYDAFGNLHFIDEEGTYHKCYKKGFSYHIAPWQKK